MSDRVVTGHRFLPVNSPPGVYRHELVCEWCGGVAVNPSFGPRGLCCEDFRGAPDTCPGDEPGGHGEGAIG